MGCSSCAHPKRHTPREVNTTAANTIHKCINTRTTPPTPLASQAHNTRLTHRDNGTQNAARAHIATTTKRARPDTHTAIATATHTSCSQTGIGSRACVECVQQRPRHAGVLGQLLASSRHIRAPIRSAGCRAIHTSTSHSATEATDWTAGLLATQCGMHWHRELERQLLLALHEAFLLVVVGGHLQVAEAWSLWRGCKHQSSGEHRTQGTTGHYTTLQHLRQERTWIACTHMAATGVDAWSSHQGVDTTTPGGGAWVHATPASSTSTTSNSLRQGVADLARRWRPRGSQGTSTRYRHHTVADASTPEPTDTKKAGGRARAPFC